MSSSKFRLVSAASTNLTTVDVNSGMIKGWVITNTNAAARYVKLYDVVDSPTVGTTAIALTIAVPASSTVVYDNADGIYFKNNIYMATTVNATDSDTTAVGAGDLIVQFFYQ